MNSASDITQGAPLEAFLKNYNRFVATMAFHPRRKKFKKRNRR